MITRRQFLKLAGVAAVVLCPLADRTSRRALERCVFGTESDDRSRGDSYAIR